MFDPLETIVAHGHKYQIRRASAECRIDRGATVLAKMVVGKSHDTADVICRCKRPDPGKVGAGPFIDHILSCAEAQASFRGGRERAAGHHPKWKDAELCFAVAYREPIVRAVSPVTAASAEAR